MWFWFAFPWWLVKSNTFSYTCWPFVCILLKYVYLGPMPTFHLPYFFFELCSLCVLDVTPLLYIWFANIFSHAVLYFHSVDHFLCCTEAFLFEAIPFVSFSFCCLCFWGHIKEIISQNNFKKGFTLCFLVVFNFFKFSGFI